MLKRKKLEVYKDQEVLEITLDWFHPKAYFMAVFSVFWMGFLAFLYFQVFSLGAPLIAKLFPILHLLAGLGMVYYTLCLFVNKTYLDIRHDQLSVISKPIPWWRGDLTIPANDIDQIYVKEKKSKTKNGVQYTYHLRAKLVDGSDEAIFQMGAVESFELKEIENHLEDFLGIEDAAVHGEYGRVVINNWMTTPKPRRQRRDFTQSAFKNLYFSDINETVNYKSENLELVNIVQYDWGDGNSDKLLQWINYQKQEKLFYLKQNGALLDVYQSTPLSILDVGNISFDKKAPLAKIIYRAEEYFLTKNTRGQKFIKGQSKPIDVEQWLYKHSNGKLLEVLRVDKMTKYTAWEAVPESAITVDRLELRDLERDEVELRRDLDEEDFV